MCVHANLSTKLGSQQMRGWDCWKIELRMLKLERHILKTRTVKDVVNLVR